MIPLVLGLAGAAALLAGWLILRRLGPGYRVGRLIAATPRVEIAEAIAFGRSGRPAYVGVDGRIDSETDFETSDHRPLVFRRTRFEARRGGRWVAFDERREAVDFEVGKALQSVAVDHAALGDGLVVVPRIAVGTAAELGNEAPADLDPVTPVRVRIDQVSSVEHATVLGVPVADEAGETVRLTAGLGRPLILTTLEPSEAMRVLAADARQMPRIAGGLLAFGVGLVGLAVVWAVIDGVAGWLAGSVALAATPTPGSGADPRSPGEGAGLVGEPLLAILAVAGLGLVSLVAVEVYVRLTGGRRD